MTFRFGKSRDQRITDILDVCMKLASGDLSTRLLPSGEDDEIEAISTAVNLLGEELEALVEERNQTEEQIKNLAYYDTLTCLPNRVLFFDRFSQALLRAERDNKQVALLYIDLDNFKNINDTLGHYAGDMLLRKVSERFKKNLRKSTTTSRLGGDEFAIIVENIENGLEAAHIAGKIIKLLMEKIIISEEEQYISASIGIAVYPWDGRVSETLLKNAETAMYHAKKNGRNNLQFFSNTMEEEIEKRVSIEKKLRLALKNNEFTLYYQPKVDLDKGMITGMESLIRWRYNQKELISPADFIPVAEETNLIMDIDKWVLNTACRQLKLWQEAGYDGQQMSVNISGLSFKHGSIPKTVSDILKETGIHPGSLELEITEGILMEDLEKLIITMEELRSLGVDISLDDFGTGYSSLSYLKRFPVSKIKIDRSFISNVNTDDENAAITKTIIAMAKNLNMSVIAEGVETKGQLDFLHAHGCRQIQGYYFSRPLPVDEFGKLLERCRQINTEKKKIIFIT